MARRAPITIELDGKEYRLKYTLQSLCMFEEEAKMTLQDAMRNLTMANLLKLLWAGLLSEDAILTVEDVGRMEFGGLQEVISKVVAALGADMQSSRPIEAPAVIPAGDSTGTSSGASDAMISPSPIEISGP